MGEEGQVLVEERNEDVKAPIEIDKQPEESQDDMLQEQKQEETKPVEQAQKKEFQIQHDRPNCIGCAACAAVAPDFWTMNEDGKSDIIGCKKRDDEWEELDIEEKDFAVNKEAAESCPVNVIHIIDKKTGDKII